MGMTACDTKVSDNQLPAELSPVSEPYQDTYYVVGYLPCSGIEEYSDGTAKSEGYFIISENLQDTLLTFNLPDTLFQFPKEIFGWCRQFTDSYRYRFHFNMEYDITPAEETKYERIVCTANYDQSEYHNATEIIITSTSKIE